MREVLDYATIIIFVAVIALLTMLATSAWADDDERCEEGDCCVGIVTFCHNEFPLPLPGQEGEQ